MPEKNGLIPLLVYRFNHPGLHIYGNINSTVDRRLARIVGTTATVATIFGWLKAAVQLECNLIVVAGCNSLLIATAEVNRKITGL